MTGSLFFAVRSAVKSAEKAVHPHWWLVALSMAWLLTVSMIAYYFWLEKPWLEYQHLPWDVVHEPVAGEAVGLTVFRCNNSGAPRFYMLSHTLVKLDPPFTEQCPETTILTPGLVPIKNGCQGPERSDANKTSPGCFGIYKVEGDAEIAGTVRRNYVHWESKPFHVYPPKGTP